MSQADFSNDLSFSGFANTFAFPISAASAMQAEVADYVCAVSGHRGVNGFKDDNMMLEAGLERRFKS